MVQKGRRIVTEHPQIDTTIGTVTGRPAVDRPYDMRRLSYAGTFSNPVKAGTIRAIEWMTAKITLLRLIREFERAGAPFGSPFWPKALRHMGIRIDTPPEEVAHIPPTGPVVVVANHPHGLVDGMVMAEIVNYVQFPSGNSAATPLIDEAIRNDPGIYPDAATMAKIYTFPDLPANAQRAMTRSWTKIKSGR